MTRRGLLDLCCDSHATAARGSIGRTAIGAQPMAPRSSWRDRRRYWSAAILTALSFALLFQLVRVYIPLAFELGEEIGDNAGFLTAGAVAMPS
jgi:hypothetical protein